LSTFLCIDSTSNWLLPKLICRQSYKIENFLTSLIVNVQCSPDCSVQGHIRTHHYMWWNLSILAGQLYNPITVAAGRKELFCCILFTLIARGSFEHSRN